MRAENISLQIEGCTKYCVGLVEMAQNWTRIMIFQHQMMRISSKAAEWENKKTLQKAGFKKAFDKFVRNQILSQVLLIY